jgi:hypothetical protein
MGFWRLKNAGMKAIMVNCNPETVSTDFDMADKLYFEPVYWEHLWEIIEHEKPDGVIVQLGGTDRLKISGAFACKRNKDYRNSLLTAWILQKTAVVFQTCLKNLKFHTPIMEQRTM